MTCPPHFTLINSIVNPSLLPSPLANCTLTIPIEYYSDVQYNALAILVNVVGVCAIITSLITLIPHLALPARREWPHVLLPILFGVIAVLGLHFIFPIAGYRYEWRDLVRDASSQQFHTGSTNAWCAFDGVVVIVLALAAVLLWAAIDIYLVLRIFRVNVGSYRKNGTSLSIEEDKRISWTSRIEAALVCGGIFIFVTVFGIASLVDDQYMGVAEGGHCLLKPGNYYKAWIGVIAAVEIIAIINTFVILGYTFFVSTNTRAVLWFIRQQRNIFAFRAIFLMAALTITINYAVWTPQSGKISRSIIDWAGCLFVTYSTLVANGTSMSAASEVARNTCDNIPKAPSFAGIVWPVSIVPIAATVFPLFFFFQRDVLTWWLNVLSCGRRLGDQTFGETIVLPNAHRSTSSQGVATSGGVSPRTRAQTLNSIDAWNTDTEF